MSNLLKMIIGKKVQISHDTIRLHLKSNIKLSDPSVSFFVFIYKQEGDDKRPYTPIHWSEYEMTFIIKIYNRNGISAYINTLKPEDTLYMSTPVQKLKYDTSLQNILMVCGGTGITPMLQILKHKNDKSKFTIVYSSKSYKDILLSRSIFDFNLDVQHVISQLEDKDINKFLFFIEPDNANVETGKISLEILKKVHKNRNLIKYDFVYVCGPPAFMEVVSGDKLPDKTQGTVSGLLKSMGYCKKEVYKF